MKIILDMDNHGAKQNKLWNFGVLMEHIWGTFDLIVAKVILISFSALASFLKVSFSQCT